MRIWTVHPGYLDRQGLLALWREALLAQKVLRGLTMGYREHPQLNRFKTHPDPVGAIGFYLTGVHEESIVRGYTFDRSRIHSTLQVEQIDETRGQLHYEWEHLLSKLAVRDLNLYKALKNAGNPKPHPLFNIIKGDIRSWERTDIRNG